MLYCEPAFTCISLLYYRDACGHSGVCAHYLHGGIAKLTVTYTYGEAVNKNTLATSTSI